MATTEEKSSTIAMERRSIRRYRPVGIQFDSRAHVLALDISKFEPNVFANYEQNKKDIELSLQRKYGEDNFEVKLKNFIDLKDHPFSVVAYHNPHLTQIRDSYVFGNYYPALTGAVSLGERVLNHMIRTLHSEFKHIHVKGLNVQWPETNWERCIKALTKWGVFVDKVAGHFTDLTKLRHESVHYNEVTDQFMAEKALEAITHIQHITNLQFGALGLQPWYFCTAGVCYIKKEYEENPFVKHYILPACQYLSPFYKVTEVVPTWQTVDYPVEFDVDDTDANYAKLIKDAPLFHNQMAELS